MKKIVFLIALILTTAISAQVGNNPSEFPNGMTVGDTPLATATDSILAKRLVDGRLVRAGMTVQDLTSSITIDTGTPTGATPIDPPIYLDINTGDLYTYDGADWNLISELIDIGTNHFTLSSTDLNDIVNPSQNNLDLGFYFGGTNNRGIGGNSRFAALLGGFNNSIISSNNTIQNQNSTIIGGNNSSITVDNGSVGSRMSIINSSSSNIENSNTSTILNASSSNISGGSNRSIIIGGFSNTLDNTDNSTILGGTNHELAGINNSVVLGGINLIAKNNNEVVLGQYNSDYTASNSPLDRAFDIGNGTSDTNRSSSFTVLENGLITAPTLTSVLINTDVQSLITRQYFEDNSGSPFAEVGTGDPSINTGDNKYTNGLVGFNEPNPEENLDVIGGVKFEHTYTSGGILRSQFGGANLQSEIGVPSNLSEGFIQEWFAAPGSTNDGLKLQNFMGDFSALGALDFIAGQGISNAAGNYYARFSTFRSIENSNSILATLDAREGTDRARIASYTKGLGLGRDQKAMNWFRVEGTGSGNDSRQTPYDWSFDKLIKFNDYGTGTFIEGYIHDDDLVNTGTSATQIGDLDYIAGWDMDGNIGEVPIEDLTPVVEQVDININSTDLIASGNFAIPVTLIPAQGVDTIIDVLSVSIEYKYNTTGIDVGSESYIFYEASGGVEVFVSAATENLSDSFEYFIRQSGSLHKNSALQYALSETQTSGDGEVIIHISYIVKQL